MFKPIIKPEKKLWKYMLVLSLFFGVQQLMLAQAPPPDPPAGSKTFTITVFLEGLYNTATDQMNKAQDAGPADRFPATIADRITIELHEAGNYGTPVVTTTANLLQDGTAVAYLPETGTYYLTIKHRNHLETVSAATINFAVATSYNFTTAASQAYGNNMLELEAGVFGVYGGDVNGDGAIDISDSGPVNTSITNLASGYLPDDVNADGTVDISDSGLVNTNIMNLISAITP